MSSNKYSGIEWVGKIPGGWEMGRVSHRFELTLGKMVEPDAGFSSRAQYPYLCAANLKWQGIDVTIQKSMYFSNQERRHYEVHEGDLLITEGGSIGTSCIYRGELGPVCYMQNSVIRARGKNTALNRFLAYWLEFVCGSGYLDVLCNKATIAHYTKDKVGKTPFPLMREREYEAIANAIDGACVPINVTMMTLEDGISVLERYRTSVIHEAVTKGLNPDAPMKLSGIDWLEAMPEKWCIRKLNHIVHSFASGTSVRAASYPALAGEKGVLSLSAVFGGTYNPNANKRIDDDELSRASCPVTDNCLLVSRCNTSEWVGLPAYVETGNADLFLPDKLWRLDCGSTTLNKFIWYALRSKGARDYCSIMSVGASSSMQNISSEDLLNMYVALPTDKGEMSEIVSFLDSKLPAIDVVLETKRKQIDVLKRRRQSLIYECVTGKRRVGKEI